MATRRRDGADTDDEHQRVLFRAVPVFDRCQVDSLDGREPAPLEPPSQPLTGDSHAHLIEPAAAFARWCRYSVAFETTPAGSGGWCDRPNQRIVVDADAPPNAQLRIVIHETAHALGIDYQTYTRQHAEVMVDTITYIVCAGLGLDRRREHPLRRRLGRKRRAGRRQPLRHHDRPAGAPDRERHRRRCGNRFALNRESAWVDEVPKIHRTARGSTAVKRYAIPHKHI